MNEGRQRLDRVTALRAFAAFAVFATHVEPRLAGDPAQLVHTLSRHGAYGVSFFFVISGFVMTWAMAERGRLELGDFWWRRFARIYPAYFVALLAATVVTVLGNARGGDVAAVQEFASPQEYIAPFVLQLTLLQSWVPDPHIYLSLNSVGWSLSVEVFFYALFPVLITLPMGSRKTRVRLLAVSLTGITVVAVAGQLADSTWLSVQAPFARVPEFVLGIALAAFVRSGELRGVGVRAASLLLIAGLAVGTAFGIPRPFHAVPIALFGLLLVACAYADIDRRPGPLRSRTMVFFGMISYSFYLVHQIVIRLFGILDPADTWFGALFVVGATLLIGIASSWLMFRAVERPADRWLRQLRKRRRVYGDAVASDLSRTSSKTQDAAEQAPSPLERE